MSTTTRQNDPCLLDTQRNHTFFLEWRVTSTKLIQELTQLQEQLVSAGEGSVVVLDSCASHNLHITMNECRLPRITDPQEAETRKELLLEVIKRLEDYWTKRVDRCLVDSQEADHLEVQCKGLRTFRNSVVYVPVEGPGVDVLNKVYEEVEDLLLEQGVEPIRVGQTFTPHITIAKATKKNKLPEAVWTLIEAPDVQSTVHGTQSLEEIVFCLKRLKTEPSPPVLMRMKFAP